MGAVRAGTLAGTPTQLAERWLDSRGDSQLSLQTPTWAALITFHLRCAQACEERLRDVLHTNEMFLLKTQTTLRISEASSSRQQESLFHKLETCANQRDRWKAVTEQIETKVLDTARKSTEHPEPVVAIAYQGANEAKNQLENQTVVLSEREVTIQSLGRELTNVRDQVQNALG